MDEDHYRILGVLDDAEDIVIKAAYRALAQKYHPDRWNGNTAEATRRMAEINAAFSVLSDPDKRRAYDATRDKSDFQDDSADTDDSQDAFAAIDKDWAIATKYKPELIAIEAGLRRIARELGTTYKLLLLEHKNFDDYQNVAAVLEQAYLRKFFGSTKIAQDFAKELILEGRRDAAKELNQTVRVLGSCDREIVEKIAVQFKTQRHLRAAKAAEQERMRRNRIADLKWILRAFEEGEFYLLKERLNSYAARFQFPVKCRLDTKETWWGNEKVELTFYKPAAVGPESTIPPELLNRMLHKEMHKLEAADWG